jgi:membrane-associated phospholipid phosphatase
MRTAPRAVRGLWDIGSIGWELKVTGLQKWLASFLLTILLVAICYVWIDRPIALLAHNVHQLDLLDRPLYQLPVVAAPIAGLALIVLAVRALMNRPLTRPYAVLLLCALSFFVAEGIKTYLKAVFGRTWPESWMGPHTSFIRDGVYGFNPFHGGLAYSAFPSGHITAVCAVVSVLWVCYRKFRTYYALFVLTTAVALVGTNLHFLSDVIGGIFLGTSVGWITTAMWKAGSDPSADLSADNIRGESVSGDTRPITNRCISRPDTQ